MPILISACLLGEPVRYNAGDVRCSHPLLEQWRAEGLLVPFCPEVAAGRPVPRPPAEIKGGRVLGKDGADTTEAFHRGADLALEAARRHAIRIAILKDASPSCGSSVIYDGTFTGKRIPGAGITAARLREAGIAVFSENEIEAAGAALRGSL